RTHTNTPELPESWTHAACPNATPCNPNRRASTRSTLFRRACTAPAILCSTVHHNSRDRGCDPNHSTAASTVFDLLKACTSSCVKPQSAATLATAAIAIGLLVECVSQMSSNVLASLPGWPTIQSTGSRRPSSARTRFVQSSAKPTKLEIC